MRQFRFAPKGFARMTKILTRLIFYYLVLVSEYLIFAHPWGVGLQHERDAVVDRPAWTAARPL